MSRSYRLSLCAAIGLALTVSVHAQPKGGADHQQPNTAQSQTQSSEKLQPFGPVITEPFIAPATQDDIKRAANALEAANAREDSPQKAQVTADYFQSQKDMAAWAGRMFWVGLFDAALTLLVVILLAFTLHHTRRAADAAEKNVGAGRAQVRAYLTCMDSKYQIVGNVGLWCWPAFKNTGKSPAKEVVADATLEILGKKTVYRSGLQSTIISNIPSDMSDNGMFAFPDIGEEYIQRIKDGQSFSVEGQVQWTDVFGAVEVWPFTLMALAGTERVIAVAGIFPKSEGTMKAINRTPLPTKIFQDDDDEKASDSGGQ
jgi:hypothetical protein